MCCTIYNMPAKEILEAIRELEAAGWRVQIASGRAHAMPARTARAARRDVRL